MKLGDYKGRKVTEPDFWKKFLIWRYSRKSLQISPKSDTDIFLKNGSNDFFGFWPEVSTKYDLQFEWNLFFRKICYLEIFDLKIVKIRLFSYNSPFQSMYSCFFLTSPQTPKPATHSWALEVTLSIVSLEYWVVLKKLGQMIMYLLTNISNSFLAL